MAHRQAQHRLVDPVSKADDPGFLFLHMLRQEEAGQHGRERQGQNQRAGQRKNHRQRHRLEHFPLHSLQGEDG